jgi:hypothetical protein
MKSSPFNLWESQTPPAADPHKKLMDCIAEYTKEYPELANNKDWAKWCESMISALDKECECDDKKEPDETDSDTNEEKVEVETPEDKKSSGGIDVSKLLIGIQSVHDKPAGVYTDTPEKAQMFEKAKPMLQELIKKLQSFTAEKAPTPEEFDEIKQELHNALGYITK